jgi:hypothetical protein
MMNGWTNSEMVETDLIIARLSTSLLVPLYNLTLTRVHYTVATPHYTVPVLATTIFLKMSFRVPNMHIL